MVVEAPFGFPLKYPAAPLAPAPPDPQERRDAPPATCPAPASPGPQERQDGHPPLPSLRRH
eukprot:2247200-Lingulodinium_polyedra.AAC.1